jgi:hypothetical protein
MAQQKQRKLNLLFRLFPEGSLASTAWLVEHGYRTDMLTRYVQRGWLESPARGVYRRPGPPLKWQHVAAALLDSMEQPPHVGALSALEVLGMSRFVPLGKGRPVHLYGRQRLPSWVARLPLANPLGFTRDRLFDRAYAFGFATELQAREAGGFDAAAQAVAAELGVERMRWGEWDREYLISTPERAMLELLDDVPAKLSLEHADDLMAGMADFSSQRVLALLAACRSVKVKRLFLALATRYAHQWVARVVEATDRGEVNLGKGKRSLVRGGKLHPKYLITLPEPPLVR